ncbi:carboxypeptidase-like regulatory domain-containing protein [Flavobacterium ardleyense]|uniref:Carboxypeptidase-like regulatory domain-containing protein n=1 Tax=Flavobacterium ardleyense TaxID=2038737 RepID=A0ABW5Z5Q4_9FLAO
MKKQVLKFLSLSFIILLASCDKEVGTSGVVINKLTGDRIAGVTVKMTSEQGNREVLTIANGYFDTFKSFSCGFSSCNDDYKIEFSKEGYETKVIHENFYNEAEATFVNPTTKDTLIVALENL